MTIRNRIQTILKQRGWSQRELARRAGITETHVGTILRKLADDPASGIEVKTLAALAKAAEVSESWLLTGEGEQLLEGVRESSPDEPAPSERRPREAIPETLGGMRSYDTQEKRARKTLKAENFDVDEWVWVHVRNINAFNTANSAPAVSMLAELAKVIQMHGDPSVKPGGSGTEGDE